MHSNFPAVGHSCNQHLQDLWFMLYTAWHRHLIEAVERSPGCWKQRMECCRQLTKSFMSDCFFLMHWLVESSQLFQNPPLGICVFTWEMLNRIPRCVSKPSWLICTIRTSASSFLSADELVSHLERPFWNTTKSCLPLFNSLWLISKAELHQCTQTQLLNKKQ